MSEARPGEGEIGWKEGDLVCERERDAAGRFFRREKKRRGRKLHKGGERRERAVNP